MPSRLSRRGYKKRAFGLLIGHIRCDTCDAVAALGAARVRGGSPKRGYSAAWMRKGLPCSRWQLCVALVPVSRAGRSTGGRTRADATWTTSGRTASTTRSPTESSQAVEGPERARTSRSRGRPKIRATPVMRHRASATWRSRRRPPVSSTPAGRATSPPPGLSRSSRLADRRLQQQPREHDVPLSSGSSRSPVLAEPLLRARAGREPVARRTTSRARRRTRARRP